MEEKKQLNLNGKQEVVVTILSVVIVVLILGIGFYLTKKQKNITGQRSLLSNYSTLKSEPFPVIEETALEKSYKLQLKTENETEIIYNLKDYSLVKYNLRKSPIYNKFDEYCFDLYFLESTQDLQLLKNQKEILIPSFLQLISSYENRKPDCEMNINILSTPIDGKYLYLKTSTNFGNDMPYSGLDAIYKLNLENLEIIKLAVSDFIRNVDFNTNKASDSYKLLPDGKRLIKWNKNNIYLINLETDSKTILYTSPQDQWLIPTVFQSDMVSSGRQWADYDIEINNNQITVGIYDKNKTQDNKKITLNSDGDFEVNNYNNINNDEVYTIKTKNIDRVVLSIPE